MIDTNLEIYKKDLEETVSMFPLSENLNIKHIYKEGENKVVNTVIVNGKAMAFGNLLDFSLPEIEKNRLIKRFSKLAIYKTLKKVLEVKLPWGALTGIRPTKLAYMEQESGRDFRELFLDTMDVAEKKVKLVSEIIENQKSIYCKDMLNTDFFVFIPFCPTRCEYCSFITSDISQSKKYIHDYVSVLIREIEESSKLIKNLRSIYIGGGTPVSLPIDELERVLNALDKVNCGVEYTVEAGRPDVITKEILDLLASHKVTRICINPQTFNDKTLKTIGRNHTSLDIENVYNMAKGRFIINMDLIAGLPNESLEDFLYSVDKAISLNPENITIHTICVKRGSRLWENTKRLDVCDIEKMIDVSHEKLHEAGYKPYYIYRQKYMAGNLENTGYYKGDTKCVYNVDVMEEISQNIACGAGAVSKKVSFNPEKIERYGNPKDILTYINKINEINSEKYNIFS